MRLYFKEGKNTEFWPGVKAGVKTHTCRKKAANVGGPLTLICGGERIDVICTALQRFGTELAPYGPIALIDGAVASPDTLLEFTKRSGFKDADSMFDYYGEDFDGYIIHWGNDIYESVH